MSAPTAQENKQTTPSWYAALGPAATPALLQQLTVMTGAEHVQAWMAQPNAFLANETPAAVLQRGEVGKLRGLILEADTFDRA